MTLEEYYKLLLKWENEAPQDLVCRWPKPLINLIASDFRAAVDEVLRTSREISVKPGSTNQSIGNQVEAHTVSSLAASLQAFSLAACSGAGYPDKKLVQKSTGLSMPFEVKATSDWNPRDSNRRVLTSSSVKLCKHFTPPIYHVLCKVMYGLQKTFVVISGLRLDFLEPDTEVNVRLEASVSHMILAGGTHTTILIP